MLNIGGVCANVAAAELTTVIVTLAENDPVEDIKPVMHSELSASLETIKTRQQKCVDNLQGRSIHYLWHSCAVRHPHGLLLSR